MIIGQTFQFPFEIALIEWLQQYLLNVSFLRTIVSLFTELGDAAFAVVLIGFFYWGRNKQWGSILAADLIGSSITNSMIKNLVMRRRPYFDHEGIRCLKAVSSRYDINDIAGQGYSFPSGHAANSGSLLTSIYLLLRNRKFLFWGSVLVFLICLSRIALGVHYPSDVLVGALLGIMMSALIYHLLEKQGKEKTYLFLLLLGLPGLFFCHSHDFFSSYGLLAGFVLGQAFDERYVRFANTRNILKMLLRFIGGAVIFFSISEALKLPFHESFLEADALLAHMFRSFRYALACFAVTGIYPYVFRYDIFKLNDRM